MPITTAGAQFCAKAITGLNSPTLFSNANSYIGVGISTTAFSIAHTDLQGATKTRKGMDVTYPTEATGVNVFKSTFATGDANHAWEEWGIFNASSAGTMLCRKVETLGTKTSAQSWEITATLTWSAT